MTITINGTTGIAGVDGSAATPAVQGADTNTGIFFPAADTIAFTEGGTEVMRIDSSGQVGIGTSSPTRLLTLSSSGANTRVQINNTVSGKNFGLYAADDGNSTINYGTSSDLLFTESGTERMRIGSSGIVTGTAGNLMLVSGTVVASTSGTAITFTGIPSWVKRITVMLSNVSTSGTSFLQAQIGSTTFTTSGYVSTGAYTGPASGGTTATSGFLLETAHTAANSFTGSAVIVNITANTWVYTSAMARNDGYMMLGGGVLNVGAVLDRVRVTTVNGTDTFDAGSINIMYE